MIRRHLDTWHRDIVADARLAQAGALLALGELLCVARLFQAPADRILARGGEPFCWPMWPDCGAARVLSQATWTAILVAIGLLGVGAGVAFLRRSTLALPLLLLTMGLLLAVEAQDFRLRQNQFYMLAIAVSAFAFFPARAHVLRHLVVQFYFWAGLLKLNQEWLSGAALYKPVWLPDGPLLRAACAWVVLLELVIVFGLLSSKRWIFLTALIQLAIFSVASVAVVGAFYPAMMVVLLAACVVVRRSDEPTLWPWMERPSTLVAIGLFCLLQFIPRLMPGDTAITGEGRLFALHMFDARVVCESTATLLDGGRVVEVRDATRGLPIRTACDPAALYARGRSLCAHVKDRYRVDLHLASRRSSDPALKPVVDLPDFCHQMPRYVCWKHNDWIRAE